MSGLLRRWPLAVALAVAGMAAAACATVVDGTPEAGARLTTSAAPHFPKPSSSPATTSSSSSAVVTTSAAPSGSLSDISGLNYRVPSGIVRVRGVTILDPIAPHYLAKFYTLRNEQSGHKDFIAIILYRLPAGSRPASAGDQQTFLERYNTQHRVSVTDGIRPYDVGGRPGFSEIADQPPDYHYLAYYVFGARHLAALTCQYDLHPSGIGQACGHILGTLRLTTK